jgi:hypothetical protein
MNQQLPPLVVCSMCGACAGLVFGNCQIFPVWVGAATGGSVGCLMCIALCIANPIPLALPVAQVTQPVIVNHIHIYEIGAPKVTGTNTESDVPSK